MTLPWRCAFVIFFMVDVSSTQDYDVTDIQCTFASGGAGSTGSGGRDSVTALLRKPEGFRGAPLFADDRAARPDDPACQIKPEPDDPTGLLYKLKVTDFSRCGVLKRNGFVHVRVWFPQFPGVVMQSDQELIIMCKPPEPTIIENKAAGFAGSFPHGARVSGVVEETPGRLEYEVALYKEAPPVTRHATNISTELPVDQAVPIGTKLQLRARISPDSAWRHVKLLEVSVSPDPDRPHAPGAVALVKDGCRNRDFASIIPHQPARYRERHNEVFLDFEAFLLASMKERSTLWIHSQIKACMDAADCQPDYCLDLYEPSGHGRRRRELDHSQFQNISSPQMSSSGAHAKALTERFNDTTQFTRFKENLEYSVVMPGELFHKTPVYEATCATSMMVAAALGALLFMSGLLMCYLATRLNATLLKNNSLQSSPSKNFEQLFREISHHHSMDSVGYTGRPTVQ